MRTQLRDILLAARMCPCDPTRGQSCRYCDGTDEDAREADRVRRAAKRAGATR